MVGGDNVGVRLRVEVSPKDGLDVHVGVGTLIEGVHVGVGVREELQDLGFVELNVSEPLRVMLCVYVRALSVGEMVVCV